MLTAIYAMSADRYIADHTGAIPWNNNGICCDMSFFRRVTTGRTVVMGGRTYAGIVRTGRRLAGRHAQIVLSRAGSSVRGIRFDRDDNAVLVDSPEAALHEICRLKKPAYVIGGPSMFDAFGPVVTKIIVSVVGRGFGNQPTWLNAPTRRQWEEWTSRNHESKASIVLTARHTCDMGDDPFTVFVYDVTRDGEEFARFRAWHNEQADKKNAPTIPISKSSWSHHDLNEIATGAVRPI